MDRKEELWKRIVEIHGYTKQIIIVAEEREPNHETFALPLLEQRGCLDHALRSKASELGLREEKYRTDESGQALTEEQRQTLKQQYEITSLEKALGHICRGFFDAADWYAPLYRNLIAEKVEPYFNDCILSAIPDYFEKMKPRMEEICREISDIRKNKDSANWESVSKEISTYHCQLNELEEMFNKVVLAEGSLVVAQQKKRKELMWLVIAIPLLIGIGVALGQSLFEKFILN